MDSSRKTARWGTAPSFNSLGGMDGGMAGSVSPMWQQEPMAAIQTTDTEHQAAVAPHEQPGFGQLTPHTEENPVVNLAPAYDAADDVDRVTAEANERAKAVEQTLASLTSNTDSVEQRITEQVKSMADQATRELEEVQQIQQQAEATMAKITNVEKVARTKGATVLEEKNTVSEAADSANKLMQETT